MVTDRDIRVQTYAVARLAKFGSKSRIARALFAVLQRPFPDAMPTVIDEDRLRDRRQRREENRAIRPQPLIDYGFAHGALWIVQDTLPDFDRELRWKANTWKEMFNRDKTLWNKIAHFVRDPKGYKAWQEGDLHVPEDEFFSLVLSRGCARDISPQGFPVFGTAGGRVWIGVSEDVTILDEKVPAVRAARIQGQRGVSAADALEHVESSLDSPIDVWLDQCSENDLIVAATITFTIDRETRCALEAIVYQLAPGDVPAALHRLARKKLISRVGDDIMMGREERKAILRHVREGEPHDSYFYRAIEHACERLTGIKYEDARAIIDRIGKSLQYGFEDTTAEVNDKRGRKKARQMLAILAKAQASVTPPASLYYAEAAIGFAASGNLAGALQILRTSVAARATFRVSDICVIRCSVLDAAMFHDNQEAFEDCLAEGVRLWAGQPRARFPFARIVETAVAQGWRESLERALTIGLAGATAEQHEEVRKLLHPQTSGTAV
jgi:hypothetical protein